MLPSETPTTRSYFLSDQKTIEKCPKEFAAIRLPFSPILATFIDSLEVYPDHPTDPEDDLKRLKARKVLSHNSGVLIGAQQLGLQ